MSSSIPARLLLRNVARTTLRQGAAYTPLRHTLIAPRASTVVSSVRYFTATTQRRADAAAAEPEKEMDSGEQNIYDLLIKRFNPTDLAVEDVSGGCGSFYRINIRSREFNGKPSIAQHRLVNETLKEVISGIHGLQLKTYKVEE